MHVETKCLSIAMIRMYKVIHLFVLAYRVGHFLLLSEIDNYHWKFEPFFSSQASTRSCFFAGFAAQRNFAEVKTLSFLLD